jgi:hypothetical protein
VLAALYVALANTYNNSIRKIVPFTQEEVDTLRVLLRRATLDAAARQRRADVLDAAVQLAKLGLRARGRQGGGRLSEWLRQGMRASSQPLGTILPVNDWAAILPSRTMKVSVPTSYTLSAVSAVHRM